MDGKDGPLYSFPAPIASIIHPFPAAKGCSRQFLMIIKKPGRDHFAASLRVCRG